MRSIPLHMGINDRRSLDEVFTNMSRCGGSWSHSCSMLENVRWLRSPTQNTAVYSPNAGAALGFDAIVASAAALPRAPLRKEALSVPASSGGRSERMLILMLNHTWQTAVSECAAIHGVFRTSVRHIFQTRAPCAACGGTNAGRSRAARTQADTKGISSASPPLVVRRWLTWSMLSG